MTEKCIGNWKDQERKRDAGKPMMAFVLEFPHALTALVRVSEFGAKKYGRGTWPDLEDARWRYLNSEMRHSLFQGIDTDQIDDESGLPMKWHALWNLAAEIELEARKNSEKSGGKISE